MVSSAMTIFNQDYMKYWQSAVEKSVDGTTIAGAAICAEYVKLMGLQETDRSLDLGCSFGRMFPVLREKTAEVHGVDLDAGVVAEAAKKPYASVLQGRAEEIPFPDKFFNGVLAWAVFDVVDQRLGFAEVNRVLQTGGHFLVTGKNARYHDDDRLAFVAERNASLKNFPNRFTDLLVLREALPSFGFKLKKEFLFARRGDLGLNRPSSSNEDQRGGVAYEYALILEKTKDVSPKTAPDVSPTREISFTAAEKAKRAGFADVPSFFKSSFQEDP